MVNFVVLLSKLGKIFKFTLNQSSELFGRTSKLCCFQVSRIARHQHVPRHVKTAREELRTIKESRARKEANRRRHAKPGAVPYVPEREKQIVHEKE